MAIVAIQGHGLLKLQFSQFGGTSAQVDVGKAVVAPDVWGTFE